MERQRKKEVCPECLLELEDETKIFPSFVGNSIHKCTYKRKYFSFRPNNKIKPSNGFI